MNFSYRYNHIETSPDTVVRFKGWSSTLYQLQLNGWSVAVDYEPHTMVQYIVIDDQETKLRGSSHVNMREYLERPLGSDRLVVEFSQVCSHPTHKIMTYEGLPKATPSSLGFGEVDCRPRVVEVENLGKIMDKGIFNYKKEDQTLIQAADMDVVDMLEAIVDSQAKKQKYLRDKCLSDSHSVKKGVNLLLVA